MTVIYGSDFSVVGYRDVEFGSDFAWDTDLVSGYEPVFLSESSQGGAKNAREVSTRGLAAVLSRVDPAAILSVGYSPLFHWRAFQIARRTRKPILFRGETNDNARQRNALKSGIRDVALRQLYRHCSALLFVGKRSQEHFRRLGVPDEKLFFSPYCVDAKTFETDEAARTRLRGCTRSEMRIQDNEVVIAFSGKLSARKGPDQLIQAVRQLSPEIRARCVVLLIGDGQLRDHLQELAQMAPVVKLIQVGFQNQTSLSRLYHAADVLVLPSIALETWGLVVNEALHHGVPTIVSDAVGCAPDLVHAGKTGETFAAGSISDLAAALSRSFSLVGKQKVRAECRELIQRHSVSKAAEGIVAAYCSAVRPYIG